MNFSFLKRLKNAIIYKVCIHKNRFFKSGQIGLKVVQCFETYEKQFPSFCDLYFLRNGPLSTGYRYRISLVSVSESGSKEFQSQQLFFLIFKNRKIVFAYVSEHYAYFWTTIFWMFLMILLMIFLKNFEYKIDHI